MKQARLLLAALAAGGMALAQQTTLTIATVNNPDMVVMQRLTPEFERQFPNIKLNWVVLPENELRQRVTADTATGAGSFDIVTVGTYEVPIWGRNNWLAPLTPLFTKFPNIAQSYDLNDVFPSVRNGLSANNQLFALPFYAESSMTFFRRDLFQAAGLTMPARPTWAQIATFAQRLHRPQQNQFGICLRGLPGWGENMAVFSTVVNTYGGRWFDQNWNATINTPEWRNAMTFYTNLIRQYGPPGATANGFTENLTLFSQGRCAMWIDATVAAGFVTNPQQSTVTDRVGFTNAPTGPGTPKGSNWLWAWSLAIPRTSPHQDAAFQFITWATSKDYIALVARTNNNWATVPPGTRASTYANPNYQRAAAAFANIVLDSIRRANPNDATRDPVPYTGVQFVGIPEFQALGTTAGQALAAVIAGQQTVDQAIATIQAAATRVATEGGYRR